MSGLVFGRQAETGPRGSYHRRRLNRFDRRDRKGICGALSRYIQAYPKGERGHGSAVNAGIANATGRYFRIVDGDDWVHTDNLIALIGLLKDTETDLVVDQKTKVDMTTERELYQAAARYYV